MIKNEPIYAPPSSLSLLQSLRGMGYTPKTAIADIIDNSISAGASEVHLTFSSDCKYISIFDNGLGMSRDDLISAMKLGFKNPLDSRSSDDLGRFWMGLKTASLGICKNLTVFSKTKDNEEISCARWDLDYLEKVSQEDSSNDWTMLTTPGEQAEIALSNVSDFSHGTLVVWENLDKVFSNGFNIDDYLELINDVESHLAITFQRYLDKSIKDFSIFIGSKKIKPIDPFFTSNPATQQQPIANIQCGKSRVKVQAFILPYTEKLSESEKKSLEHNNDLSTFQGFYVYRENRLIVQGGWLGLGESYKRWIKEEAYKLARISIDIENSDDQSWKIDIKKSSAQPPASLKADLIHIALDARRKSRAVFAHRGQIVSRGRSSDKKIPLWLEGKLSDGSIKFSVNKDHPYVKAVIDACSDHKLVTNMISLIEQNLPVQKIWLESAEGKDPAIQNNENLDALKFQLEFLLDKSLEKYNGQKTRKELLDVFLNSEPYSNYPELYDLMDVDHE